ncbi:adenosine deaminase [Microlunatus soli]|uniref:Aminodeoxyfutalosine deaminase n=1 Tax=Microlunatus soli TaxID=630515 RepID=A0A1H1TIN4_9ACTN|nr:adenosine deaminase [Microlunatus soli]SDS60080.1 aminodeoxyfutalosine deaminase [Microlunatus soli]
MNDIQSLKPSPALSTFIAGLPKAELHVHHVGSATPQIVTELAARHPEAGVPADLDTLIEYFTFTDFADFIQIYLSVVDLIREPQDVRLLTYEVAAAMAAQQIRYAELTVTPYTSVLRGIAAEAFLEAIEDARVAAARDHHIELRWIFDIPGEEGIPAAEETCRIAVDQGCDGLIGFGLGGPEIGVGRPQFKPYFDRARAAGLHSLPHAGETTGPQTIKDALDSLGAERIGHGTSAVQDRHLLERLAADGICLEVCPTSNVATGAVEDLSAHPLPTMVRAGVPVTINSDDPPMFGTSLNQEYEVAAVLLDLDAHGVADLARAAVDQSFAPADSKTRIRAEIDTYEAGHAAP